MSYKIEFLPFSGPVKLRDNLPVALVAVIHSPDWGRGNLGLILPSV